MNRNNLNAAKQLKDQIEASESRLENILKGIVTVENSSENLFAVEMFNNRFRVCKETANSILHLLKLEEEKKQYQLLLDIEHIN